MDLSLVERARGGDAHAFDELVISRIDTVYRITLGITANEADARDATQEAFLAAWRGLPRLRDLERFDAWLTTIVVNAARAQLRRRRRIREIRLLGSEGAVTPDQLDADGLALLEVMGRLPVGQREILALHHLDDQPVDAIAGALGIPVGTVKSRLNTARRALRALLEDEPE